MSNDQDDHPAVKIPKQVLANNSLLLSPGGKIKSGVTGGVPKKRRKKASSFFNIKIHSKSQISAQLWKKKIKDNSNVPEYFGKQINTKGNTIFVSNPTNFRFPDNVIEKPWLNDWLSAFLTPEWEVTTGCLDITVKKVSPTKWDIIVIQKPDLSSKESLDGYTRHTMTNTFNTTADATIVRGNTLADGISLVSNKKLIIIMNRVTLKVGGDIKTYRFNNDELIEVWFHEIACHAGRNSQGVKDYHTKPTDTSNKVESCAKDIKRMFPKATTAPKVFLAIDNYL